MTFSVGHKESDVVDALTLEGKVVDSSLLTQNVNNGKFHFSEGFWGVLMNYPKGKGH